MDTEDKKKTRKPAPPKEGKAFVKTPKKTTGKLDEELIYKLKKAILAGAYVETAASYCGINRKTFYRWLTTGARTKRGLHWKLCQALEQAWSEAEVRDLMNIDRCAFGRATEYERHPDTGEILFNKHGYPVVKNPGLAPSWQASAWRLERKFSKRWSTKQKLEVSGDVSGSSVQVFVPDNGRSVERPENELLVEPKKEAKKVKTKSISAEKEEK